MIQHLYYIPYMAFLQVDFPKYMRVSPRPLQISKRQQPNLNFNLNRRIEVLKMCYPSLSTLKLYLFSNFYWATSQNALFFTQIDAPIFTYRERLCINFSFRLNGEQNVFWSLTPLRYSCNSHIINTMAIQSFKYHMK